MCRTNDSSELSNILRNLKSMFGKLFDYIETEEEFDESMLHIKKKYE